MRSSSKINGQETVGVQFKRQLSALMETIGSVIMRNCLQILINRAQVLLGRLWGGGARFV